MISLETVESLQAYGDRLHRDAASRRLMVTRPRTSLRTLLRSAPSGRRTA
jgi:hypothetical protein